MPYTADNRFADEAHLNVYRQGLQMAELKWTPKADVIDGFGPRKAGVEITGVPYSSVKEYMRFVGIDVSIHTFMTAVHDIHSLFYTENCSEANSKSAYGITYHGVNCSCYFGSVCSGFTATCLGTNVRFDSWQYRTCRDSFFELENQDVRNLEPGDVLSEKGHVAIITEIARNDDGSIRTVTLSEHTAPIRRTVMSVKEIADRTKAPGGVWCRYRKIHGNTHYRPSPFVLLGDENLYSEGDFAYFDGVEERTFWRCKTGNRDSSFSADKWEEVPRWTSGTSYQRVPIQYVSLGENLYRCVAPHTSGDSFDPAKWERVKGVFEWAAYPYIYNDDIVTFAGDRAVFSAGSLIRIDYRKGNFSEMQLYRDGEAIRTIPLPQSGYQIDVSDCCAAPGMYKARLTDGNTYSRFTYFEIIDTNVRAAYEHGKAAIRFSSANGRPLAWMIVRESGFPVCQVGLTDEESAAGKITVDPGAMRYADQHVRLKEWPSGTAIYARIVFAGEYGNVPNPMIRLGEMDTQITGDLVYPDRPADLGILSSHRNIILANRLNGHTYSFRFTAEAGSSAAVYPVIGEIRWASALPEKLREGTTYLVTVTAGIGSVLSVP